MPPAFVLSQDQTLMFNPYPPPAQEMGQLRASITLTPDANPNHKPLSPWPRPTPVPAQASDDPRRRPRIPSYSQQCQSTSHASGPLRRAPSRGEAAYKPIG